MDNDWRNARIEEAAKAMHGDDIDKGRAGDDYSSMNPETLDWYRDNARAALAVFEKAHTPTDDDPIPPCSCPCHTMPGYSHIAACCTPPIGSQGEPSDVQLPLDESEQCVQCGNYACEHDAGTVGESVRVHVALRVAFEAEPNILISYEAMRAALRAAGEVR